MTWKWFGTPGHYICSHRCLFHLCTQVGDYLVSTVGGLDTDNEHLDGKDIGLNRKYETMAFKAGPPCDLPGCMCGQPAIDGYEVYFSGYNDRKSATEGHMRACHLMEERHACRD